MTLPSTPQSGKSANTTIVTVSVGEEDDKEQPFSYLFPSVLLLMLGNIFCGVPALISSCLTQKRLKRGDVESANRASNCALCWNAVGFIIWTAVIIAGVVFFYDHVRPIITGYEAVKGIGIVQTNRTLTECSRFRFDEENCKKSAVCLWNEVKLKCFEVSRSS